jgi:FAD/FMN-containing dehydrogenase
MRFFISCLSAFLFVAVVTSNNISTSTCDTLLSRSGNVLFPESPDYNASVSSYPFIQLRLHPTCVFQPRTAQDVSTAVKLLSERASSKFAVKGGGHNANIGFNNIEDGVTIDLQKMNAANVTDGAVKVGAGAIWQNVYDAVEPHNLTVLGGRIGVVGVGGFTTGGMLFGSL